VVVVRCPTGCGPLRRPYALRAQPVRCANCTAWFAAAPEAEDGSLCDGVLLAHPGDPLIAPRRRSSRARQLGLAVAVALAVAAAALVGWAAYVT
jgi:hypothetical protein